MTKVLLKKFLKFWNNVAFEATLFQNLHINTTSVFICLLQWCYSKLLKTCLSFKKWAPSLWCKKKGAKINILLGEERLCNIKHAHAIQCYSWNLGMLPHFSIFNVTRYIITLLIRIIIDYGFVFCSDLIC